MPHVALGDLAKICGPMMSLNLGTQIVVVASSPDTAKEILKNRVFSGRFLPSVYYNVPGVTQASLVMARECNDIWKFLRGVSQNNVFSAKAVESAAGIRAKIVTDMVEFLRTNKAGKSVKLEDVVSATFINIISNVLVSKNVFDDGGEGETDGRVMRFINKLVEGGTTFGVTDVFPVLKWVDFWSKGLTTYIFREICFIWGEIVKERRMGYHDDANYDNSTKDFLDVLNEYGLSDDQIGILLTV
ncbi:hypothetical protein DH2020_030948 [Rehmannia glutinosa]|uniref:Uncharacterized protein n=1 Tax=Rehmannia glutinosa TaxID=99300 RepID=A0ABR0VJI4_REHGL